MQPFSIVIPFRDGHRTLPTLLRGLPPNDAYRVVVVDDVSDVVPDLEAWPHVHYLRLRERGFFAGAVNAGVAVTSGQGVLVLNQDVSLEGRAWLDWINNFQGQYAIMGHGQMKHPAWPAGYVQGQFMYLDRAAWEKVGSFNAQDYPLWGCTAEWQLRACRLGYAANPVQTIPGMRHERPEGESFGSSIRATLEEDPTRREWYLHTPPQVSVIVTSYNYGRYLTDCINSLVGGPTSLGPFPGQTFQSFEVIIVDDASTDETPRVGKALANPWKAIRYIRRPQRGGTPAANNTGIRASFGRYITILCADDMRESWSLEALYRVIEKHPKAVVYDDMQIIGRGQRLAQHPDALPSGKHYPGAIPMGEYGFDSLVEKNMMHAGIMYDRRAFDATGGYDERMAHGREDWQFNIALGLKGYCGKRVPGFGYLYRREQQNRSLGNQGHEWRRDFVAQLREIFPDLYRGVKPMGCCGNGAGVEPSEGFRQGAERSLGADEQVGAEGMVLMHYLGGNDGEEPWYGPDPRRTRYVFSKGKPDRLVDRRDVNHFLNMRENRRPVFELAETEPELQEQVAEVREAEKVKDALDGPFPPSAEHGDPLAYPPAAPGTGLVTDPGPVLAYPLEKGHSQVEGDPRTYTVPDYTKLLSEVAVSPSQAAHLLTLEQETGKPRKGIVAALTALMDPEQDG